MWTVRTSRTSRRTGWNGGSANRRLRSGRRLTDRIQSEECSSRRPTANFGRWASRRWSHKAPYSMRFREDGGRWDELATQCRSVRSVSSEIVMAYGRPGFLRRASMRPRSECGDGPICRRLTVGGCHNRINFSGSATRAVRPASIQRIAQSLWPPAEPCSLPSFAFEQKTGLLPSLDRCDLRFGRPEKAVGEHHGVVVIIEFGMRRKREAPA